MGPHLAAVRDRLGVHPLCFREDRPLRAGSVIELLRADPEHPLRPDRAAILRYLAGDPDDRHTCVEGIGLVPAGHALRWRDDADDGRAPGWRIEPPPPLPEPPESLPQALVHAIADLMAAPRPIALALSGGLDSALVLAIVRRELGRDVPVVTLAVDIPGYGELPATRAMSRALEVELHEIPATADDFVTCLPRAVRAAEVPLWNPHPVSKLLLARALRREGFSAVLTGDAADQAFCGAPGRDYLPLVGRLFRSQGIEPCSPFFDPRVLAHAARRPPDPHKWVLRELAARWLPTAAIRDPKAPRLVPDLGVERLVGVPAIHARCQQLGLPAPRLHDARARCGHTTLCLLWDALSRELRSCAASSG